MATRNAPAAAARIPPSAEKFLEKGTELACCPICQDPFTTKHVAIRIKACGHQYGENCLELWLRRKDATGTCPLCRGVLFKASPNLLARAQMRDAMRDLMPDAPVSPTRFVEYYRHATNVLRSAHDGFLSRLWTQLQRKSNGEVLSTDDAERRWREAHCLLSDPERCMLLGYFARISSLSLETTGSDCPVTSLYRTLKFFSRCCCPSQPGSMQVLSDATWCAIMRYQTNGNANATLHWADVRNAAWMLYNLDTEGSHTGDYWRVLHVFFMLVCIHGTRLQVPVYEIKNVLDLLRIMGYRDDAAGTRARDFATRVFVLAARRMVRLYKFSNPTTDGRISMLVNEPNAGRPFIKLNVESLWLESMGVGVRLASEKVFYLH
ncbi:RING finger domain [Pyrenophora seminiperda CCB06]|uniref:RING finger domain n=1 Tax=Pyrenophora seminiperda CCB06 TaxID=1302712 RepID=A0A3M7MF54_9PLEO|nr:RING finger domain [Pyrenophora seminiperda CCB06]